MQLNSTNLTPLAARLLAERKRQGLTREQMAAVCNVSPSFIRDAESAPGRCTLERLLTLAQGMGLRVSVTGWQPADADPPSGAGDAP